MRDIWVIPVRLLQSHRARKDKAKELSNKKVIEKKTAYGGEKKIIQCTWGVSPAGKGVHYLVPERQKIRQLENKKKEKRHARKCNEKRQVQFHLRKKIPSCPH
jgi:hypothetical protein